MTKARDLADLISAGNPLADGAISVSEISDLTATAAEINQLDGTADLPDIRPSLLLDFANSKTLDPRITFTRGSTATYWDGKTTAKAEENLAQYSQQFDNGYWTKLRISVSSDQTAAPDGTTTADQIIESTDTGTHGIVKGPLGVTDATMSVFAKQNTRSGVVIKDQSGNGASFNLSSGTVISTTTNFSSSITSVGNGWYRCTVSGTFVNDGLVIALLDGSNQSSYTGDGTSSIYLWGAQVEQRSSATAYTATTSSPIVKYQPVLQTAASGEARFDHDPVTGESKGLLIEEARTNLVPHSTDPTATNMTSVRSASTDISAIAPDGTFTARKHTSDATSTGEHYFATTNASITSGSTYTASYYIKDCGVGYAYIKFYNAFPDTTITVDLSDKTVNTLTASTFSAIEVTDVGNDWYRISVTQTADATSSTQSILFGYTTSSTSGAFLGDGYKGAFIWGMQLEVGSFPTSYIPTSGSTVTRAAENAYMSDLSMFAPNEFTVYVEGKHPPLNEYRRLVDIGDDSGASNNNTVCLFGNPAGNLATSIRINGTSQGGPSTLMVSHARGDNVKAVIAVAENDAAASADGLTPTTDTTLNFAGVNFNRIWIGRGTEGYNTRYADEAISKIAIYPKRLPNATLQAMTEE